MRFGYENQKETSGKQAKDALANPRMAATQTGKGRGKTPVGRSHPSGEHLGTEASEKDFCLCYGNIVALTGMLPCHEQ